MWKIKKELLLLTSELRELSLTEGINLLIIWQLMFEFLFVSFVFIFRKINSLHEECHKHLSTNPDWPKITNLSKEEDEFLARRIRKFHCIEDKRLINMVDPKIQNLKPDFKSWTPFIIGFSLNIKNVFPPLHTQLIVMSYE